MYTVLRATKVSLKRFSVCVACSRPIEDRGIFIVDMIENKAYHKVGSCIAMFRLTQLLRHPEMSISESSIALGISISSVNRLRRRLKEHRNGH